MLLTLLPGSAGKNAPGKDARGVHLLADSGGLNNKLFRGTLYHNYTRKLGPPHW